MGIGRSASWGMAKTMQNRMEYLIVRPHYSTGLSLANCQPFVLISSPCALLSCTPQQPALLISEANRNGQTTAKLWEHPIAGTHLLAHGRR
jgi:hypothetical protein